MATYPGCRLKDTIVIDRLHTVYYFEYSKNYRFTGESHSFWELVYVDKGEIIINADQVEFLLSQGEVVFHKPDEWHSLRANGTNAPNLVIISFASDSKAMTFFENKTLKINQYQKRIISRILSEYSSAFSTPLNNPTVTKPIPKKSPAIGSQQLLKQYLCELLLSILRSNEANAEQSSQLKLNMSNSLLNLLVNYMCDNLNRNLRINDLVRYSGSNKTTISNIFHKEFGKSPIEYFTALKIERAKVYLREETYNITQIAEVLGYSSVHYFSRCFKKVTGMAPSQYANSVRAMEDRLIFYKS